MSKVTKRNASETQANHRRNSFTFYASWYDAVREFDEDTRGSFLTAITELSLYGNDIKPSGVAGALYELAAPTIRKSYAASKSGKQGGKASRNDKQNTSESQAKG